MAIYRFTMKKTMRSVSTWILIILPLIAILAVLLMNISSAYQRRWNDPIVPLTPDQMSDKLISYFRWNWIWIMRTLVFFFLFAFVSIKSANIFRDEIDEGTLLIIVSKPISRWSIFWEKWLGLQTNVFLLLTISLWIPAFASFAMGIPSGAIKWLFTNIALTWVFSLFIQLIITSLGVMLSLVMGSKGSISLFSLVGVLGFVLWLPSFFLVGVGSLLAGNGQGMGSMDGGLSDYLAFKKDQKNYPLLFDKTYKNFQDNDGNGLYETFKEYYNSISGDGKNPLQLLEVSKRDKIIKQEDVKLNVSPESGGGSDNSSTSSVVYESYVKNFLLKEEWLRDYENIEIFQSFPAMSIEEKKTEIKNNKTIQDQILKNLDFDKLLSSFPFKGIVKDTKKITFSIHFKTSNDNLNLFKNDNLFFWQDENEKDILKPYSYYQTYHLNYDINKFSNFLKKYNGKVEDWIKNTNNEYPTAISIDRDDIDDLKSAGYDDTARKEYNNPILYFTFDYEDIKNNPILKNQLFKKLISLIPTQISESSSRTYFEQNIKNDLLFYKPTVDSFNPVLKAFNNSAKLAEQYYQIIKTLADKPEVKSKFEGKESKDIITEILKIDSNYNFPNILSKLEGTSKIAANIKTNNIISIFNIFEHFEKMFKAMVEPNTSWGPIGLSAPYEMSLKFYTGEDGIIYGTLWENSSYRSDQIILFTIYSLITIFSTFSAFALLKFKNLT